MKYRHRSPSANRFLPLQATNAFSAALLVASIMATLLTGCTTARQAPRDDERTRQFIVSAYQPAASNRLLARHLLFTVAEQTVDIELLQPESAPHAPLVIYLPGLGDSSRAGEVWRRAWAEAGYAVMSLQPLTADTLAWSSDLARSGDFVALERERFGERAMIERLQVLAAALREARRRADAGDPDWRRVDFDRAAIAGFDLGAFAAMIEAGEQPELPRVELPITMRAVFALSPYASFAASGFSTRYRAIRAPVLSITSDNDRDPAGLVSSPSLRIVPFQSMPTGDKYLLVLNGVSHAALGSGHAAAGTITVEAPQTEAGEPADSDSPASTSSPRRRSRGQTSSARRDRSAPESGSSAPNRADAATIRRGVAAIEAISTAFLDAYVKDDDLARSWLTASARDWTKVCGELRSK